MKWGEKSWRSSLFSSFRNQVLVYGITLEIADNRGQKTLGHLRKSYASTKSFEGKNYRPFSWSSLTPSLNAELRHCGLVICIKINIVSRVGRGRRPWRQFVRGKRLKCSKTSDHGCRPYEISRVLLAPERKLSHREPVSQGWKRSTLVQTGFSLLTV